METQAFGVAAALSAALFFALGNTYVKKGMMNGDPRSAHRISLVINMLILWPVAIVYMLFYLSHVSPMALIYFALAGIASSGLGRLFSFMGIERMGVSESTQISAISPLFTAAMGVMILSEEMSLGVSTGTALVIVGLLLLSRYGASRYRLIGITITVLSAFFFALGDLLRKVGLTYTVNPPLGAALGSTVALLTFYPRSSGSKISLHSAFSISGMSREFVLSGILMSMALLMEFIAFSLIPLVIASPLIRTTPLFALLFTHLILKGIETVRFRTIVSAVLIVVGIVAILTG